MNDNGVCVCACPHGTIKNWLRIKKIDQNCKLNFLSKCNSISNYKKLLQMKIGPNFGHQTEISDLYHFFPNDSLSRGDTTYQTVLKHNQ